MSETISLTIPNSPVACSAAAEFFKRLALGTQYVAGSVVADPNVVMGSAGVESAGNTDDDSIPPPGEHGHAGDARVDTKGVAFNADFCGNAAEPFYGTGPRAGQWKKRKGVDDAAYDKWYEDALLALAPAGTLTETSEDDDTPPPVNTGAAFSSTTPAAGGAPAGKPAPQTAGEFMAWVSEKQAGGSLSQAQIQAAYGMAGVQVADLFTPDAAAVATHVGNLYAILSSQVGA